MARGLARRDVIGLGAAAFGGWAVGRVLRRTAPLGRRIDDRALTEAVLDDRSSPASGPVDATLRLAVFSDYRCPACRRAFPALEEAARTDGSVRIIYKDWPIFGPQSERAARVALAAAEQGIYPAVHRALMTDSRVIADPMLREIVMAAGGDWSRAEAVLRSQGEAIAARLHTNGEQAVAIGLPGTPGYLAGSILVVGAIDRGAFTRLFAKARAAGGGARFETPGSSLSSPPPPP